MTDPNGTTIDDDEELFVGSPEAVADALRPIVEVGFRHLIIDAKAPYDVETIERLPEVRALLAG